MRRIGFFRSQLLQRAEIFNLAFQFLERIDQRTYSGNFLDISLGALPIRPKIGRSHARFNCGQVFLELFDVKETSTIRARAISDPQHLEWRFPLASRKIIQFTAMAKASPECASALWGAQAASLCSPEVDPTCARERRASAWCAPFRDEKLFRLLSSNQDDRAQLFPSS